MVKIYEKHAEVFTVQMYRRNYKQENRGANADSTLYIIHHTGKSGSLEANQCVLTPLQIATASLDMDLG